MNLAEFSIKNRLICGTVILLATAGGWFAYLNMPRFEDPEFIIRQAQIYTEYPGASPLEVAEEVTEPLESALQQLTEIDKITSTNTDGKSQISVEVKYEFSKSKGDLQSVWSKLRNKVKDATLQLPPGVGTPYVNDDFGDVYGLYYMITGDGYTPKELNDYAKKLRTDLLAVDGVGKVLISGNQKEAIYVEISRERASSLGVSVGQLYQDLSKQNSVISAGDVQMGDRRLVITPTGNVDSVESIKNVIVSTPADDTIVYLKDIATVRRDYVTPSSFLQRYKGQPALGLGIANVPGANVVKIGQAIDEKLAATLGSRPLGVEVHEFYHQGKVVDIAVKDFAFNVFLALVIVLVTLFFFMGLRSAIVIGGVLLFTIAATLTTMYLIEIPMHRISLGALIIALGMLVDNAIVVTEGILVGTQQGRKKLEIAKEIVSKTIWPLLGGTLVGIIAFAPIGFAPGQTAEYTGHLFWVVMISLFFSWIFAITLVPLFADLLFKETSDEKVESKAESKFLLRYKTMMRGVLRFRWIVIGSVAALFALSVYAFQFVKPGFFPASTTPQIVVDYWLPQGTDISVTQADMLALEKKISQIEGVDAVHSLIGGGSPIRHLLVYGPEPSNISYGQFLIKTNSYDAIAGLMPKIQSLIDGNFPNAQGKVWQFALGPGGGSKIEAEFTGPDPVVLRQLANEAKAIMAADPKAIMIKDTWRQPISFIQPQYSETRGRRLGISREDLASALETNFSGKNVGVYRDGDTLVPIVARAPEDERQSPENIANIQIASSTTGNTVPLTETVDGFKTLWRDGRLIRENRVWLIKAQADPAVGELASDLFTRVQPAINAIKLPEGYHLKWGGEHGDSAAASGDLAKTIPLGFLAMVLVVVILFNSFRQPIVIWLVVPLSLIGVVSGLLIMGVPMEFMAILGLLSLSGLLIKNGIVLVDQMDLEIKEGKPRFDAIVDSAASRVRPVMMGALTTVLGVIPLFTDAFFKSMAVVLVFGLTFATVLTLIVVPAFYSVFFRVRNDERA